MRVGVILLALLTLSAGCSVSVEPGEVSQVRVRRLDSGWEGRLGSSWADRLSAAFEARGSGSTEISEEAPSMVVTLVRPRARDVRLEFLSDRARVWALAMPEQEFDDGPLVETLRHLYVYLAFSEVTVEDLERVSVIVREEARVVGSSRLPPTGGLARLMLSAAQEIDVLDRFPPFGVFDGSAVASETVGFETRGGEFGTLYFDALDGSERTVRLRAELPDGRVSTSYGEAPRLVRLLRVSGLTGGARP